MSDHERAQIRTTIIKLTVLGVSMFVFAVWVMPPIYNLFCELTGLNGKTKGRYQAVEVKVDTTRKLTVQFVSVNNKDMPWYFEPSQFSMTVHPGEAVATHFVARNNTQRMMVGQAIPSMVPNNATNYFHKTECFCFNQQVLAAGEEAELGLQFIVDQDIPKGIKTITLSYSLFDVTHMVADSLVQKTSQTENQDTSLLTALSR